MTAPTSTLLPGRIRNILVLTRHTNEKIMIGDDITLVVISIQGDKVQLGIDAPKYVTVHRREVYDAIQQQKGAGRGTQE